VKSRFKKLMIRIRLAARQNRAAIFFVAAWLGANFVFFVKSMGMSFSQAALVAACVTKTPGGWPGIYQGFTEVVVFGLVASVVLTNVTRKYRPQETARELASQSDGHVVVIGFSHLGRRVHELVLAARKPVVVVEEDGTLVEHLVREEDPVVVGSPRDHGVLDAAAVARAKVVVIATDDLEAAAVACRRVRERNASCELVVRCADEDVGSVLAKTYRARAVSTSRLAASFIQHHAVKARVKSAVVMGKNSVGARATEALLAKRIAVTHVDTTEDPAAIAAAGIATAELVVVCDDDLGKNLVRVDRIRDVNKRAKIICRAFHEDAAEVLVRDPLSCIVLSTSRHAAESLARAGVFREVGIDEVPTMVPAALPTPA
jgi:Trk K+ transport system NAD-binding subunit